MAARIPDLQGAYFFGDFCSAQIWSFRWVGGAVTDLRDRTAELAPGGGPDDRRDHRRSVGMRPVSCTSATSGARCSRSSPPTSPVDVKFVG